MDDLTFALLTIANAALWLALAQIWDKRHDDTIRNNRGSLPHRDCEADPQPNAITEKE